MPGILSIGKIMPDRMMVGIISTMADTNRAATCVWVMQEISSPNARDTK